MFIILEPGIIINQTEQIYNFETVPLDEQVAHSGGVATFSINSIAFADAKATSDQNADDDQDTGNNEEVDPVDPYDVSFLFEDTQQDMHWGEKFPGRAYKNLAAFRAAEIDYHGCVEADLAQYEKLSVSYN